MTTDTLTKKQQSALKRLTTTKEREQKASDAVADAVDKARHAGLTWRTIADHLDIPLSTVYSRYATKPADD